MTVMPAAAQRQVSGVPHWLADARAAEITNLNYLLNINIPTDRQQAVTGNVTIMFDMIEKADAILDFQGQLGSECMVNGVRRGLDYTDEHIVVPKRFLRDTANVIELNFTALDIALNRNTDYMYTLFVPDHARSVFPCFDQPDLKATFQLNLTIPEGWTTISSCGTKPIPTYLFSFVAGRFQERVVNRNERPIRILYRETDPQKVAQIDKVADLAAYSLTWLEQYTNIEYPFDRYSLVLLPGYQFGGMEHPGAIQLNSNTVLLGKNPTQDELLKRVELIAHETAHAWFGNLVTMRWFDDVWTKEVFANFLAAKISQKLMPEVNQNMNFMKMYTQPAISTDRTDGTHPIQQQLDNLNQASLLYGNIIYDKAPVVMRKLEERIGATQLRDGLRNYLDNYAFRNASWDDLIRLLDARIPDMSLKRFSDVWVKQAGMPTIYVEYSGGRVVVTQNDPQGRGLCWPQEFELLLGYDMSGSLVQTVRMGYRKRVEVSVKGKPQFIVPNFNGQGYGHFILSDEYARRLPDRLICTPDDAQRLALVYTLFDNYLIGRIPGNYFSELYRMMLKERNPLVLSTAAQHMMYIARHSDAKGRRMLEHSMVDLVSNNKTPECRQQIVRQLSWGASSLPAIDLVYKIWNQHRDQLFSERDYMQMAYHLAMMKPTHWRQIITTQRGRLNDEDLRREFDYVSQACNPSQVEQLHQFEAMLEPYKLQSSMVDGQWTMDNGQSSMPPEPWVVQKLALLCNDSRQPQNLLYLKPGLEVLENLQKTGGIFFPSHWLNALLSRRTEAEARREVDRFLREHPNTPPYLMRKIKEAAWLLPGRE